MDAVVFLGVVVAACWGTADIFSAEAGRLLGAYRTTLLAQAVGTVFLAVYGFVESLKSASSSSLPLPTILFAGALLGVISAAAYVACYRSLCLGPLSVCSPIISVNGAVSLLLAMTFMRERVDIGQLLDLTLLLVGCVLASFHGNISFSSSLFHTKVPRLLFESGIPFALVALVGLGILNFGVGVVAKSSDWLLFLFVARCFSLWVLFLAASFTHQVDSVRNTRVSLRGVLSACSAGGSEILGVTIFAFTTQIAPTGITAMIAAAGYVLVPLLFGLLVYKERLQKSQAIGIANIVLGMMFLFLSTSPLLTIGILMCDLLWFLPCAIRVLFPQCFHQAGRWMVLSQTTSARTPSLPPKSRASDDLVT